MTRREALAPSVGIINAVKLCVPFWIVLGIILWVVTK